MTMTLTDILKRHTEALERAVPALNERIGAYTVATIRETWPDVGGRWPYATGRSSAGWVHASLGDGVSVRITNDVDHHRYTEYGYTRQAPYTAQSYRDVDYSAAAVASIDADLALIISDAIGGALRA